MLIILLLDTTTEYSRIHCRRLRIRPAHHRHYSKDHISRTGDATVETHSVKSPKNKDRSGGVDEGCMNCQRATSGTLGCWVDGVTSVGSVSGNGVWKIGVNRARRKITALDVSPVLI